MLMVFSTVLGDIFGLYFGYRMFYKRNSMFDKKVMFMNIFKVRESVTLLIFLSYLYL